VKGACDSQADLAKLFPVSVFMELMGMDLSRLRDFRALAEAFFSAQNDEVEMGRLSAAILGEMKALIEAKKAAPDDKLMSPYGMWREWFVQPGHRCLIPITAFAEAVGPEGQMTRTWISIADQPLAACAGFWRPTDEWGDSYTMVMVDAVPEMLEVHDRMPVILHPEDHEAWLHAPAEEAMKLVTQYPADRLVIDHTPELWYAGRTRKNAARTAATLL